MIKRLTAAIMKGNDRFMYQSKSCLNGIKKIRRTKVAIVLISRRKLAHEVSF